LEVYKFTSYYASARLEEREKCGTTLEGEKFKTEEKEGAVVGV